MKSVLDFLASSALSLTVSGNTGISPFLTLLILGVVEISDPTLLNMGDTMEAILAGWYSIAILAILTLLEIVGKCVPVVDEFIDSVEVWVVPVLSIFGTLGVVGLLDLAATDDGLEEQPEETTGDQSQGQRLLEGGVGDSFLIAWKVVLVVFGIGLSLLIHFFKMIIRISGLVCCLGCCHPCITIVELSVVCCGVVFAILIQPIAIITCLLFLVAASYTVIVKCKKKGVDANGSNNNGKQVTIVTTTTTTNHGSNQGGNHSGPTAQTTQPTQKYDGEDPAVGAPRPNSTSSNTLEHDPENPPPYPPPYAPSTAEIISISELTPIPPPPTNPDYDPNADHGETPIAVAVPIAQEEKSKL
mmetsp:Transcript_22724/g.36804  ORF Transcript_22724/g.36804 Transcript_22724/m.36804 type:complete len:358 (+) Transcript_22724:495-1568(+)